MTTTKGNFPRATIFSDPHDFHETHPNEAELLEDAAADLREAHTVPLSRRVELLAAAESYTLRANGTLAEQLGADPRRLLPLVRLAVEAIAHQRTTSPTQQPPANTAAL